MKITREAALALCAEFEAKLAGERHVGLTGSCLYGATGPFKDMDIIIYPAGTDFKDSEPARLAVMNLLGIDSTRIIEGEYEGIRIIYKGTHIKSGVTVDAFFLT